MIDYMGDFKFGKTVDFDQFKERFFLKDELIDTEGDSPILKGKDEREHVLERLRQVDQKLQKKFSSNWTSLRRAFLDLD